MESGGVCGHNMELIRRSSLGNSLLGDSDLFNGETWNSNSSVRRMDGHGI